MYIKAIPGQLVNVRRGSAQIKHGEVGHERLVPMEVVELNHALVVCKVLEHDPYAVSGGDVGDTLAYPWSCVFERSP